MGLPLCPSLYLYRGVSDNTERIVILSYPRNGKSAHQGGPLGKTKFYVEAKVRRETSRKWLNVIAVDTPGPWLVGLVQGKESLPGSGRVLLH